MKETVNEIIVEKVKARMWETKCRSKLTCGELTCNLCECKVLNTESYKDCKEKYEDLYLLEDFETKMRTQW